MNSLHFLRAHGASAQTERGSGKLQRVPHEAHAASASPSEVELIKKEKFVRAHPAGTFFQSGKFGEFQESIPYRGKVFPLVVKNERGEITGSCLAIKMKMRFGKCWLWVPYGPLFEEEVRRGQKKLEEDRGLIYKELERVAKEEGAIFARVEPPNVIASEAKQSSPAAQSTALKNFLPGEKTGRTGSVFDELSKKWRIEKSPSRFTPEHTLILDLEKSEEEILAQMKPKGRYNIGIAQKRGVLVQQYSWITGELGVLPHHGIAVLESTAKKLDSPAPNVASSESVPGHTFENNFGLNKPSFAPETVRAHSFSAENSPESVKTSTHAFPTSRPGADFDEFYKILQSTSTRDGFQIHPKFFYENLLKTFGENAALFLAYAPCHAEPVSASSNVKNHREILKQVQDDKRGVAGIIVIFYKDTATYYYGASNHADRALMAPYLLQWEAIIEAKKRGMKHYDFLGIAPSDQPKHPYAGITDFKKKFGGREVGFPPAFDIVYKPLTYTTLRLLKKI